MFDVCCLYFNLFCFVLFCCVVLCCVVLCCVVLCCVVLCCVVLCSVLFCFVLFCWCCHAVVMMLSCCCHDVVMLYHMHINSFETASHSSAGVPISFSCGGGIARTSDLDLLEPLFFAGSGGSKSTRSYSFLLLGLSPFFPSQLLHPHLFSHHSDGR